MPFSRTTMAAESRSGGGMTAAAIARAIARRSGAQGARNGVPIL
jgi:hypothetical protein